ncbi:helix-turn-helix domain-containing protein [Reichenbachiella versicolor]|uniref:helix-turn-helix domain-containing protein n=1 Tax=Reichenbachiella versicolor TaxID=1821036 RepID=UPI000D6E85CF|nr:AraC family transcriptional regulator [Reichenbachiella versicolor]
MPRTIIENIVIQHYEEASNFEFCQYTSIRFFEIVYFHSGTGTIRVNKKVVPYTPKSVFIFIPDDVYIVQAESVTTVTTIKFLKNFFNNSLSKIPVTSANDWFRKMEGILHSNSFQLPVVKFKIETEIDDFAPLIKMLIQEYQKKQSYDIIIIENVLTIILHLIARNMEYGLNEKTNISRNSKIQDIINFIHSNIYEPYLLTSTHLADVFNLSENYVSQYFKKNMSMSLKKYILNYKLKIVETKLKYTDLSYSEIALDLGFTDASHLNKTFLTYKGISIGDYKAQITRNHP